MLHRFAVVLIGLLALSGCTSSPAAVAPGAVAPGAGAAGAGAAGAGAPNDAAHGAAAGAAPLAFGATSTDANGLAVTVAAPQVGPLPAGAKPVRPWPSYVTFAVTVVNGTAKGYDPQSLFVSLTSGKDTAEQIFAAGAGLRGAPTDTLVPGARTSFTVAYGVSAVAALTLEIAPDFTQPTVVYQG